MTNRKFPTKLAFLALSGAMSAAAIIPASTNAQTEARPPIYTPEEMLLDWPIAPENKAYASLKGSTIREVTEKLAEISRTGRDRENLQYWGRIIGTQTHDDATQWVAGKLRQLGVGDVRSVRLDVPPQSWPHHWNARVRLGDQLMELKEISALSHGSRRHMQGFENKQLELVYVGLGTEADFRGRDVKGKAVMIYSQPNPSMYQSTATVKFGAVERAQKAGASMILLTVGLPGNMVGQATLPAGNIPAFMIGAEDFFKVREMLESSPTAPIIEASLSMKEEKNPKTTMVFGMLPGTTDENIIVSAHIDGYYESAYDNGSGVASLLALAEYFAAQPKQSRRRNIYFVVNPGHHVSSRPGTQYLAKNWQQIFAKTALLMNLEHPPYLQQVAFPDSARLGTGPGAILSLYIGGSDVLRKTSIDALRSFGVATSTEERPMLAANAVPEKNAAGLTIYKGIVGGDTMDIAHLAPFFQVVSADWPYHSEADKPSIIHWPGVANYARAHARIIDSINSYSIAELSGGGHPIKN